MYIVYEAINMDGDLEYLIENTKGILYWFGSDEGHNFNTANMAYLTCSSTGRRLNPEREDDDFMTGYKSYHKVGEANTQQEALHVMYAAMILNN